MAAIDQNQSVPMWPVAWIDRGTTAFSVTQAQTTQALERRRAPATEWPDLQAQGCCAAQLRSAESSALSGTASICICLGKPPLPLLPVAGLDGAVTRNGNGQRSS